MPELPEVETVCRGLAVRMEGRRIAHVEVRRPALRFPLPADFARRLHGCRVRRIRRRAKYILMELDNGLCLLAHLGMTGRFYIHPKPPLSFEKHDHVVFTLDDGGVITFNDARRFGFMDLIERGGEAGHKLLKDIGPEPLDPGFTPALLSKALKGRKTPIKAALLDQKVVAGLGNIYVSEALNHAHISPRRLAGTVAGKRTEKLVPAIKRVLTEAIKAGGSTLRDYVQANGELGYFQARFRVYDRVGSACPGCGGTIKRIVQSGRSTFYCTKCQT